MNIRNGTTVHTIGKAEHIEATEGRDCLLDSKDYPSINAAKKANGLKARTLRPGEKLPMTPKQFMMAKIPEAA